MIGAMEEAIVMGDDDESFALGLQIGEDALIEDPAEGGVLIGRPLIEEHDRAVFQIGVNKGQPLSLAGREIDGTESTVVNVDLVRDLQLFEVSHSPRGQIAVQRQKIVKQKIV